MTNRIKYKSIHYIICKELSRSMIKPIKWLILSSACGCPHSLIKVLTGRSTEVAKETKSFYAVRKDSDQTAWMHL